MAPADAYRALRSAGLSLRDDGGTLKLSPAEALTDELLALAKAHKPGLLALLGDKALVRALDAEEEMHAFFLDATADGWPDQPPLWELTYVPTKAGMVPSLETKRLLGMCS